MLSVNKKFNDEQFFKRVMQRKYPLLLRFQKKDESIKSLFVRMTYAMAKLQEEFGIPYMSTLSYNPSDLYRHWKHDGQLYNRALRYAVRSGDLDAIKSMIGKEATAYNWVMGDAVKYGHLKVVKFLIDKITDSEQNIYLITASAEGHIDIVKFLFDSLNFNVEGLNMALNFTSRSGHTEIVKLLVQKGATDLNRGLLEASKWGHLEIVKFLVQQGATNFASAIAKAKGSDYTDIINYLQEK
tara:strand:- start:1198 stop:1920 length:723 start_codon:yes stop_codon:yes gene_type:complete